jgi:NitT/TauT family transport system substrate-binding protein
MKFLTALSVAVFSATFLASAPSHAEVKELRIAKQPGLVYLPAIIVEGRGLVEKHAKAAGLGDLKVSWVTFAGGGASTDALLAGNVEMVASGSTNLLLLWDKTKGGVKGVAATGATPMMLLTNNPDVKKLSDYTDKSRIAVPTIKLSAQATALQIAAEKEFGKAGIDRFNAMTVQMSHPDALIQLQNKSGSIDSHFSLPPYQNIELKLPGVHSVLNTKDVYGGPVSNSVVFATTKFHDENPKVFKVFLDAMKEAEELFKNDKKQAAQIYLEVSKDKISPEELVAILEVPDMIFSVTPYGTGKVADFMSKVGYIKTKPASWKDYFFSELHDLPGS